ncbi:hypothetical protein EGW08_013306 [Elysia chlorotica]|uniref:G-protein coupled receptors family 1 profile domain-containing protein n=1 Tax=Elysia chlorotica TaxID=188477 RepID=A0A3S1BZH6_ELYCH|nr:hypothetical protein EGW08_013306 [Elysia chlorotica]
MWNVSEIHPGGGENQTAPDAGLMSVWLRNTLLAVNGVLLLLLSLAGLVTNALNMLVFGKTGLNTGINISFFALSAADFACAALYVLEAVIMVDMSHLVRLPVDIVDLEYVVSYWLVSVVSFASWVTGIISVERCLCIVMPVRVKRIVTRKLVVALIAAMLVVQSLMLMASLVLMQFEVIPAKSGEITLAPPSEVMDTDMQATSSELTRPQASDRPRVFMERSGFLTAFITALLFWATTVPALACYIVIVVSTTFLAVALRQRERWLQTLPGQTSHNIGKNRKLVTTVVAVSVIYIVCFSPGASAIVTYFALPSQDALNVHVENLVFVLLSYAPIFQALSGMANIFVYFNMNARYRHDLKSLVGWGRTRA